MLSSSDARGRLLGSTRETGNDYVAEQIELSLPCCQQRHVGRQPQIRNFEPPVEGSILLLAQLLERNTVAHALARRCQLRNLVIMPLDGGKKKKKK
jgi:hypothetical protein